MPLDINLFREDRGGDPEKIRESQRRRFKPPEAVDEIITHDNAWRKLTGDIDFMKKDRNAVQKQVGAKKKAKEPCDELVAQIKQFDIRIAQAEAEVVVMKKNLDSMVGKIGNIVDPSVPISKDEDSDNLVVRTWGNPRSPEGLLNHHDLLWRIGGYEPERGVAVAGHRGYFLKDVGVMLNQAFINYGIAFLRARDYTILQPPYMMKKEVMAGVAQLEQFDEELYKVGGAEDDKYLIATSEQPICGYYMGEWLAEKDLPIRMCGSSTCFRKEAGAHGKDTWGIFRVHQFEKIEQFVICEGDLEKSQAMQERMSNIAEEFYKSLGFPYRVISIVSGALNNAAIKKLDLECWFPGYDAYRELVSCSNCTDYQSRSMEIRCGVKKLGDKEKKYVHMLNSTLCATGRAICCLLETYQEADGVRIPEVLVPFMGGLTFLPFVRDSRVVQGAPKAAAPKVAPAQKATPVPNAKDTPPPAPKAAAAPEPELSAEGQALKKSIEDAGNAIREKKSAKASKEEIKALVDQLLALKTSFTETTGLVFGPP
ncbi:unnamed protein product, partial [Ectocarpus fasciculatus]